MQRSCGSFVSIFNENPSQYLLYDIIPLKGSRQKKNFGKLGILSQPLPALVGNKRVYGGGRGLVSYYLPGNGFAQPPSHRGYGTTAHTVVAQAI